MSTITPTETPAKAPFPIEDFMKLPAKDQSTISLAGCDLASTAPCVIPVQVGLFFDGTNNNMERDLNGRRIGLPDPDTGRPDPDKPLPRKPMKPEECSHTNVVRLFRSFPGDKRSSGYYRYYIPGVGTEFREIGELAESEKGKAFGKGGYPRIIWGIFQVLNAIHMTAFEQDPLYDDEETGKLAQAYDDQVGRREEKDNDSRRVLIVTHKSWFAPHLKKLKEALATKPKPRISALRLSVFGFSRGAAEAVAFCHFFNDLLEDGKLIGIEKTDICFLGLFDVVASVGLPASIEQTTPLPAVLVDGHLSWAKRLLDPLPGCVKNGEHFIAMHELRMNFPVTVMQNVVEEIYFPGVHSDVGGGYAPGEQGKSRGTQAALLSQIPLAHMYKAARLAGVPLRPFSELEVTIQDDFKVDAGLASAWNAYMAELEAKSDGDEETGAASNSESTSGKSTFLKSHMRMYYRWRAARLGTLETASNFKVANAQDKQDLSDANRMLAGDLQALRLRKKGRSWDRSSGENDLRYLDMEKINQHHQIRVRSFMPLDEWEQWALEIFNKPKPLPPGVMQFFDDYVHDSFAGFYMAGEVTEYDKRVKTNQVMRKNAGSLKGFDKKVYEVSAKTKTAQEKKAAGETLTPEEEGLVEEAKYGTPYPVMTDQDSADMRNGLIRVQTDTRREGGGYIIRRSFFPQHGFLREYIDEKRLRLGSVRCIWSDNPIQDMYDSRQAVATARSVEFA